MGWQRIVAFALVVLFLGMTFSSASATASFVNSTTNSTIGISSEPSLEKTQRDHVHPENVGTVTLRVLSIFIPGLGDLVIIGTIASILAGLARYLYGKPVAEFTEGFISEFQTSRET